MGEPLTPEEERVARDLSRNELRDRIQEAILDLDSQELMAMAAGDDMEWRRDSPLNMAERIARRVAPTLDAARAAAPPVEPLRQAGHTLTCQVHRELACWCNPVPPSPDRPAGLREAAERVLDWADHQNPWNPDGAFTALYEATGRRRPEGEEPVGPRYYRVNSGPTTGRWPDQDAGNE